VVGNRRRRFGEHIADLRGRRGWSQAQLADELRVTRTVVSAWENDRRLPRADHLEELARVLGDDGELVALAAETASDEPPLFDRPVPVASLVRRAADSLVGHISSDDASDGEPGYGWRQDVEELSLPVAAWSTAYGLKTLVMAGGHASIDVTRARAMLRRLELPDGGWSAMKFSPIARPEVTGAVLSALHIAGEPDEYLAGRIRLLVDILDRRAPGAEPARPYVLTAALLELGRLGVDDATGRRLVDTLVDLSLDDDGRRAWPSVVRSEPEPPESVFGSPGPSTIHTAAALCALAVWARRFDDGRLDDVLESGRSWLERSASLDVDDEDIISERADGGEELLPIRHFTPAWVLRALSETGSDPEGAPVRAAMRATLSHYEPMYGLWHWPRASAGYPVWMTHQAVAALVSWGGSHRLG
jgi:transcriptional regulator with XRE-family HTH domain